MVVFPMALSTGDSRQRSRRLRPLDWALIRVLGAISLVLIVLGGVPPFAPAAHAAPPGTYPYPLPDFSHPDSPHAPLFHNRGTLIPLLVVYATFNDLTNVSEADIEKKFFGLFTFGTVADYYLQNGIGVIAPATETFGKEGDGVVVVDLGASGPGIGQDPTQRRRTMMDLADPFVNFARYDTDGDGSVENDELAVATIFTSRPDMDNCGQTRNVAAGGQLDGKTIAFSTADGGTATNGLTLAHELGHQIYSLYDHYGFGVGSWDIAGPTCGGTDVWFEPNAWTKMHLGADGEQPTVITKDTYVALTDSIKIPYLLYDPERGTDDYFLVEARAPRAGTYEEDVPDSGAVIWRIDERNVRSAQEHVRGVELLRPDGKRVPGCFDKDLDGKIDNKKPECSGGSDSDAWDPEDKRTPQRTMNAPWADGTSAKVAVRAIGRPFFAGSLPNMWWSQVYLDVRGPGVLVDPADARGIAPRPALTLGSTGNLSFAVMNTGEATDTFSFTELVPPGWTASTQWMKLAAGEQATATIRVTVPTDARVGQHSLIARGRSGTDSSIQTDYQFLVDVVEGP